MRSVPRGTTDSSGAVEGSQHHVLASVLTGHRLLVVAAVGVEAPGHLGVGHGSVTFSCGCTASARHVRWLEDSDTGLGVYTWVGGRRGVRFADRCQRVFLEDLDLLFSLWASRQPV